MVKIFAMIAFVLGLSTMAYAQEKSVLKDEVKTIRYLVTAIEHQKGDKIERYGHLITNGEKLIKAYPEKAEPYIWKAIALAAQAKHKGISALSNAKEARELLEKAIRINPSASDGAAYNALGMLYYKVPAWPIGFGNNDKAESYFQKALVTSSNVDMNYRYGEFLIEEEGEVEKGLVYLHKALSLPNRTGRKEDALKKEEIKVLIKENEAQQDSE